MNMKAMQTTHPLFRKLGQRDWIEGLFGEGCLDLPVGAATLPFYLEDENAAGDDRVGKQEHLQDPEWCQRP